jgi:hypothetical protein
VTAAENERAARPDNAPGWRQGWVALGLSVAARGALGVLATLLLCSVLPSLVGWQSSVVMSASMAPGVQPGDLAVVRPVSTGDLAPGQVLLVDDPDVPGHLRLHRLVAVEADGLRLRGDANPAADSSLVTPAAVHGVAVLRLPAIGSPVVWLSQGRVWPLAATGLALAALLGLAVLHHGGDDGRPAGGPRRSTRGPRRHRRPGIAPATGRRVTTLAVTALAVLALPAATGADATFNSTTRSPTVTLPMARYWSCPEAASTAGATQYYRLQDSAVANTGSSGSAGSGGFSGTGITFGVGGPTCGAYNDRAVALDGSSGQLWSTQALSGPQTFTVQVWFATTTWSGGKLVGFGNGSGGATSSQFDRHIYMLNSGQLAFGVYNGATTAIITPYRFNDGAWHLATATFSASTGMALYVDGQRMAVNTGVTTAESNTGYWRVGYDNLNSWPNSPASSFFRGSLAHVSIFDTALSATEVANQASAGA